MPDLLDLKFAALADPTRRALLARLAAGEASVAELARPFAISQPAISRHLKLLEAAGLIESGQSAQARPRRLKAEGLDAPATWLATLRNPWPDSFDNLEQWLGAEGAGSESATTNNQQFLGSGDAAGSESAATTHHAPPHAPDQTGKDTR